MRDIEGFSNYSVSINGEVFSYKRQKVLRPFINNGGYHIVRLRRDNTSHPKLVHRLVALAYIPNDFNKKFVNHMDGDKNNNSSSNLEWVTFQENIDHSVRKGGHGRPRKAL